MYFSTVPVLSEQLALRLLYWYFNDKKTELNDEWKCHYSTLFFSKIHRAFGLSGGYIKEFHSYVASLQHVI